MRFETRAPNYLFPAYSKSEIWSPFCADPTRPFKGSHTDGLGAVVGVTVVKFRGGDQE